MMRFLNKPLGERREFSSSRAFIPVISNNAGDVRITVLNLQFFSMYSKLLRFLTLDWEIL